MFAISMFLYFGAYASILLLVPFMSAKGFSAIDCAFVKVFQNEKNTLEHYQNFGFFKFEVVIFEGTFSYFSGIS